MDISSRRIVITEDDDLDLDKLLLGDNSGAKSSSPPHALPSSSSLLPSLTLPLNESATSTITAAPCIDQKTPASPLLTAQGEKVDEVTRAEDAGEDNFNYWILPASAPPGDYINNESLREEVPSKPILKKISTAGTIISPEEEGDDGRSVHRIVPPSAQMGDDTSDSLPSKVPSKSILKDTAPTTAIFAEEAEGEDGGCLGYWVLPAPAQPGDYLQSSVHRVPSKSILKKTSSYANFDSSNGSNRMTKKASRASFQSFCIDSSSTSQGSIGRCNRNQQVANNKPLNAALSDGIPKTTKKSSFLNLDASNSNQSQGSQGAIGYDFDASSPSCYTSPKSLYGNNTIVLDVPTNTATLPSVPQFKSNDDGNNTADADRAAGMESSSGTIHSGNSSARMRRNVSFHSVDVREYDRIVGDNPSCRAGPPLSLDWSYAKTYEKDFEEFEQERSTNRLNSVRKLHVNKYKRKNLLAFNWGHSEEELKEARRETKKMQRQRSMTQLMLPVQRVEEAYCSIKNFIKKKKKGGKTEEDAEDWSDISNSASTKASTKSSYQHHRASNTLPHQDSGGLPSSSRTT